MLHTAEKKFAISYFSERSPRISESDGISIMRFDGQFNRSALDFSEYGVKKKPLGQKGV